MSRQIPNDHLWDDDEREYQLSRGRVKEVEANRQQWSDAETDVSQVDSPKLKLDQDIFELVKGMSVEDLQAELRKRELLPKGDEKELKVQLASVLQSERDQEKSDDTNA